MQRAISIKEHAHGSEGENRECTWTLPSSSTTPGSTSFHGAGLAAAGATRAPAALLLLLLLPAGPGGWVSLAAAGLKPAWPLLPSAMSPSSTAGCPSGLSAAACTSISVSSCAAAFRLAGFRAALPPAAPPLPISPLYCSAAAVRLAATMGFWLSAPSLASQSRRSSRLPSRAPPAPASAEPMPGSANSAAAALPGDCSRGRFSLRACMRGRAPSIQSPSTAWHGC